MITLEHVTFSIKGKSILEDINLVLEAGSFTSIIGPNGAGKSTLLKIILGTIKDYSGKVLFEGVPQKKWLLHNYIGYVPQKEKYERDFPATALDIVLMGIAGKKGLFSYFTKGDKERALDIMKRIGIEHYRGQNIGNLSGGEFQKVLLARALMCDTDILLLDEPETSVDLRSVKTFYQILEELNKQGKTIVVVSHDLNTTTRFASSIACLNITLHSHGKPELLDAEIIKRTYGDVMQIIERKEHD